MRLNGMGMGLVVGLLVGCNVALEDGPGMEAETLEAQEGEAQGALWTSWSWEVMTGVTPAPAAVQNAVNPVLIRTAATFRRHVGVDPPADLDWAREMVIFHAAGGQPHGATVGLAELLWSDARTLKMGVLLVLPGANCQGGATEHPHVLARVPRPDAAVRSVRYTRSQTLLDCQPPPPPPPVEDPVDVQQQLLANPGAPVLEFQAGWRQFQHGLLVAGQQAVVDFDPWRLTTCRNTHNGHPAWDITGHVRFLPGGEELQQSVRAFETVNGTPTNTPLRAPWRFTIPAGTTRAEFWFHNTSGAGSQCEAYDSNFGGNHVFDVVAQGADAVVWAGDWGGSFSRACTHQDGLAEPITVDSYVMQRACSFVDADVYVPYAGDVVAAQGILAQVEWSRDGGETVRAWLEPVERVGNNQRFRWWLPRTEMGMVAWSRYAFVFRFSVDGVTWTRLGREDGGTRTVVRNF